jgi:hypothetical protein
MIVLRMIPIPIYFHLYPERRRHFLAELAAKRGSESGFPRH